MSTIPISADVSKFGAAKDPTLTATDNNNIEAGKTLFMQNKISKFVNSDLEMKTKDSIFNQAVLLFAKHGYSGTSIRNICDVVGIKESSFYNHYSGKKELMNEILKTCQEIASKIEPSTELFESTVHNHSLREMLHFNINSLSKLWEPNTVQLWFVVSNEAIKNPDADKVILIGSQRQIDITAAIFDRLQQYGKMVRCNSHQVAYLFIHSMRSQLRSYYISMLHDDIDSSLIIDRMHETADLVADMFEIK